MADNKALSAELSAKAQALYFRYKHLILNYVRRIVYNDDWVKDAAQDTMLRIMRNMSKFDEDIESDRSINLVITMARCAAIDTNRLHARQAGLSLSLSDEEWKILPADVDVAKTVENRMMYEKLKEEIQGLPENYRAPMDMKFVQDFDNKEIAEELGITPNNAAVRISRGSAVLRMQLIRRGEFPWELVK